MDTWTVIGLWLLGIVGVVVVESLLLKFRPALALKTALVIFETSRSLEPEAPLPAAAALEGQDLGPWKLRFTKISDDAYWFRERRGWPSTPFSYAPVMLGFLHRDRVASTIVVRGAASWSLVLLVALAIGSCAFFGWLALAFWLPGVLVLAHSYGEQRRTYRKVLQRAAALAERNRDRHT